MMVKKNPLGENPLSPDSAVRELIRGDNNSRESTVAAHDSLPPVRKAPSTTTPGGLLRKTVYFSEAEWKAIKAKAYREDRPYTDIVREAVRALISADPGQ